ncbi:MAG TPA: HNH endonuclease family protein [Amycolatopsis sp.]|uniref:HNH endonuclease family protein n=1 Tax=Amycolatopsis sp. TaxID=37632 RepID=UPI002B47AB46|nr:HNH endonuclease family protein [Amycolatopsis sp.]HKS45303.1 HNH endonuclease family protein [Amycolatopsis sp.]
MKLKSWLPVLVVLILAVFVAYKSGALGKKTPGPGPAPTGDAATARAELAQLVVHARGSMQGYSRDKFPHWEMISGECDTRETVLKRDGQNVQTDAKCEAVSGSWRSPYDGATWTKPSDVDIDHLVPLGQAWESGAAQWSTDRRKELANDLTHPQLFAVTDNVNQAKGDKAPDEWRPPLESDWCAYAVDWIEVKSYYQLTVIEAEKSALSDMLNRC